MLSPLKAKKTIGNKQPGSIRQKLRKFMSLSRLISTFGGIPRTNSQTFSGSHFAKSSIF